MTHSILIVDDSLTVRMDLAETFETAGFNVLPCATLKEARHALARRAVDLAILDVMLPDGNGVDLVEEIRREAWSRDLPVLMLSSETAVRDRNRGLKTGANDYVGKPYNPQYVVARARELLHRTDPLQEHGAPPVLVVDDSLTFREALHAALKREGYRVLTAASGEEGLRLAAAHRPAALILDGEMPGMHGETVLRKIRLDGALRTTPCLMLTAAQDRDAELRALDAGADGFVRKEEEMPVIMARFLAMLRNASGHRDSVASLVGPKRILVIDDDSAALDEIAAALRDDGYDVVLALSGEAAIDLLALQGVDCILLDQDMPGLGGTETCRRIKASPPLRDIPLVVLAGADDGSALIDGLNQGADDYLRKSGAVPVLLARIRAQIRRKQFEQERRSLREQHLRAELEAAEARAARELAETRAVLVDELKYKNEELEAFSYSVSHDLRAPLRAIDGFSQALLEDCEALLDEHGKRYLERIRSSAQRMSVLIDDMLLLSKVSRTQINPARIDLSAIARNVVEELSRANPGSSVRVDIAPELLTHADPGMMRILLDNLLGNAWKFSSRKPRPQIEFKSRQDDSTTVFHVRDNGAGFDMAHAANLFQPFKRLHLESEFNGTGIGLATVQRIIARHGGRVWAEGIVGQGATVFFALPKPRQDNRPMEAP